MKRNDIGIIMANDADQSQPICMLNVKAEAGDPVLNFGATRYRLVVSSPLFSVHTQRTQDISVRSRTFTLDSRPD